MEGGGGILVKTGSGPKKIFLHLFSFACVMSKKEKENGLINVRRFSSVRWYRILK